MNTITKTINWIIGTAILIVGVLFTVKTYYATFESNPEISVSETLRSIILSTASSSSPKIDFYLNDKRIERATVSNFKIVNQGKTPIEPSHFHQALTVKSLSGEDIVSVNVTNTNPESLLPEFKKISNSSWTLTPLLLNPGDEINVVVIALTNQNNQQSQIFPPPKAVIWNTRIKGMKDLRVQDYELFNEIQTTFTTQQADTLINQMKIG